MLLCTVIEIIEVKMLLMRKFFLSTLWSYDGLLALCINSETFLLGSSSLIWFDTSNYYGFQNIALDGQNYLY